MANRCDFSMIIRGRAADVDTFYRYLTDYDGSPKYFARIFSADIDGDSRAEDGTRTLRVSGDCAWSVYSCMCDGSHTYYGDDETGKLTCLRDATEELHLEVEVCSTEPGLNFWEHFWYKDGECLCDEAGELPSSGFEMERCA